MENLYFYKRVLTIGYSFENAFGKAANDIRCRLMITFWSKLTNINLTDMWFQQNGTTLYFSNEILKTRFTRRAASRNDF